VLGRVEHGEADDEERSLLRLLTALTKLTTGKQVVAVCSEAVEAFGGAGYVEDTGLPVVLRDAQVLPIWEGTTNVLSLELLKAADPSALAALRGLITRSAGACGDARLAAAVALAGRAADQALAWHRAAAADGPPALETGARRFALTLGRATALALLCEHAQWALDHERDTRPRSAAIAFSHQPIDLMEAFAGPVAAALALDEATVEPSALDAS
jgi:hypothetical protein